MGNTMDNGSKSIGEIISASNNLTEAQVNQIVEYQRVHKVKFGEAAVSMGLIQPNDVLWALSQQFDYPNTLMSNSGVDLEVVTAHRPFSDASEKFRDMRSQLITAAFSGEQSRPLALVSHDIGDGKSFFAANLGVALSQLGGRTVIVDADMRTPRQHKIFASENNSGLSSFLASRSSVNLFRPVKELPSLYLLTAGVIPPNPQELVQRTAFDALLNELSTKFTYVLVDTPAWVHGSDARVIASKCGSALLIARKNRSGTKELDEVAGQLKKTCKGFVGTALNDHGGF